MEGLLKAGMAEAGRISTRWGQEGAQGTEAAEGDTEVLGAVQCLSCRQLQSRQEKIKQHLPQQG